MSDEITVKADALEPLFEAGKNPTGKLRANGMLLAADIKKSCGKLKRAIEGKAKKLLKSDNKK